MAITPFRQVIRPGQAGSDILAVKRAMQRIGISGAGSLITSGNAGSNAGGTFVKCLETVQRHHGIKSDGIYGPSTHTIVAASFDAYGVYLYKHAKLRNPPVPSPTSLTAQDAARQLLAFAKEGKYHADNWGDLLDIEATAVGRAVWSRGGYYVHVDPRPLRLLVWLIQEGHTLGTFAICSDHHYDGPHGHSGGLAVDISSIDGLGVSSYQARSVTLTLAQKIHDSTIYRPWQLICDGYGYMHDSAISALTIPYPGFYGYSTMAGHRNHIHVGYY